MAEVADIFRHYGSDYLKKFAKSIPQNHVKVMRDVVLCRTESLGGEVYHCRRCNANRYSYHSCGNRHCPRCQNDQAAHWLSAQEQKLLSVPYFLLTLTIPASLRSLARSNQKIVYNVLFKAVADTLATLARDPRLLGGTLGFMSVLHTWTNQLIYHPHIHAVIPGGALSLDHSKWLRTRGKEWFLPVRALSKMFRGKFLDGLKRLDWGSTFRNLSGTCRGSYTAKQPDLVYKCSNIWHPMCFARHFPIGGSSTLETEWSPSATKTGRQNAKRL